MDTICTVLLISYNHAIYIEKAILSVLEQKTKYKYKIYIFDDGSTDNTADIIRKYEDKYPSIIKAFISESNEGAQANFWKAYKAVDTEFCAILECDDYWCNSKKLERELDALYENPKCSFCAHNTSIINIGDTYRKHEDNTLMVTDELFNNDGIIFAEQLELIYQGYINHCSSRVIRMSCVDLDKLQDKESFLYDNAQFFYLISKAPMYYINEVMSVYVQTGKGIFSGVDANKRLRTHINNLMQVNEETNYTVEKIIFEHIHSFTGYWLWLSDISEGKYLKEKSSFKKIIKYLLPQFIIDILRWIKGGSIK